MTKKLYNVTVTYEVLVAADDAHDAIDLDISDVREAAEPEIRATPATYMPGNWGGESLPLIVSADDGEEDMTVTQWLAAGAAPEMAAALERVSKSQKAVTL